MDVLLGLAAKISREYGFSAFVLALMMMLFFWIVTNKNLINVADRVLNKSLTSTNLYKFIKLGVILVFIFSSIVAVLSFATPIFMRRVENRSLELVLQGKAAFKARNYGEARDRLEQSLELMNPDEPTADEIRGLITATYYVNELHEQGLEFICTQYKYKPAADRSYLFSVHAHLRKIAVIQGTEASELIASRFRKKCGRYDFSKFWAHIPFGMMESLRTSRLRSEHGWELTPQSSQRLRLLVKNEQEATLSKSVPLGDFALYFLGDFDDLLATYPDSTIRDMALFDAAMFDATQKRTDYLATLIAQHPKSLRFNDAVVKIAKLLADQGQREKALSYVALIKTGGAVDRASLAALGQTFGAFDALIRQGDIVAARTLASTACQEFEQKSLPCNRLLERELRKSDQAIEISAASYKTLRCSKVQEKLRELSVLEDKTVDSKWLVAARSFLISCLDSAQNEPDDYARSMYLIAALSRRSGDYKTSLEYLRRFEREITEHDLLDDVIAELGYHKFVIERDWDAAKPYFERVIQNFKGRNAWDNALWWYAKGCTQEGNYPEAISAYAMITSAELSVRYKKWSGDQQRALERLTSFPPFVGVSLKPGSSDEGGVAIAQISADAPTATVLAAGDRLVRVCDKPIYSIEMALKGVAEMQAENPCDVSYLRGRTLIKLSRARGAGWHAESMELDSEQLRKLVLGVGRI